MSTALNDPASAIVERVLLAHAGQKGALLPVLHGIQDALGYVPPEHFEHIGRAFQMTRAEIHGVVTFYHDFRTEPAGRHIVRVCRAESCRAVGGAALEAHLQARYHLPQGHGTSHDRAVTLQPVYCLGLCAASPSVMIDGELHARLDVEGLEALLASLEPA